MVTPPQRPNQLPRRCLAPNPPGLRSLEEALRIQPPHLLVEDSLEILLRIKRLPLRPACFRPPRKPNSNNSLPAGVSSAAQQMPRREREGVSLGPPRLSRLKVNDFVSKVNLDLTPPDIAGGLFGGTAAATTNAPGTGGGLLGANNNQTQPQAGTTSLLGATTTQPTNSLFGPKPATTTVPSLLGSTTTTQTRSVP